jgi:WD40 repeat protein/tRNA A-37 threonylcarbamoyl transferase component Bud32
MSYCLNLRCQKPQNPSNAKFCSTCGARLLLDNRYRAIQSISQGGMGRTFLAVDEQEGNKCIIKQFSPQDQGTNNAEQALELFRQEAQRLWQLGQHPQIPQVLAYFEPDPQPGGSGAAAIVQTLIEGESLAQKLKAEGAFGEIEVKQILQELLPVLQFVHERNIIHRDINPENIIRSNTTLTSPPTPILAGEGSKKNRGYELVLVDFSAAKFTSKTALAKTGTVIGSAAYISPEQMRGKAMPSSDLYSLGVTCIHLLTDIHPFDLFNSLEGVWVWQDYLTNPINPQLAKILNKMLEDAVKNRYQSALEILKDLEPEGDIEEKQLLVQIPVLPTITQNLLPTWKCIKTLQGHFSSINSIALSWDGKLASGSADRTVKLWDLGSNKSFCTFFGHFGLIDTVAFSPNGRFVASGSWDYTIKIWDVETKELVQTLSEHSGWIKCLLISPDGKSLISGSADKTIKIWNLEVWKVEKTFEDKSAIQAIAISPDGQFLASGRADKTIKIWNLKTGELHLTINAHSDAINALVFSSSGQIIISGSADKTIKIWQLNNSKLLHTLNSHSQAINSLAINIEGNLLVSGSADKTLKIWHLSRGELLQTLDEHSSGVTAVAIGSQGQGNRLLIASGSQDQTLKIWQFE